MKNYKTWEVIKMLDENRKLKFYDSEDRVISYENGKLVVKYMGEDSILDLDECWELVKNPVDFLTAIKAFQKGKTITCELITGTRNTYWTQDDFEAEYYLLEDEDGDSISSKEILEGAWFIED